jgi:ferredoxin
VAAALASGARAALSVHAYLTGEPAPRSSPELVGFSRIRLHRFSHSRRLPQPHLAREDALEGFAEVNLAYPEELLLEEVGRCFSCGLCSACDICLLSCPDAAITRKDSSYAIDEEHCKGCGICVEECPRYAMAMVPVT